MSGGWKLWMVQVELSRSVEAIVVARSRREAEEAAEEHIAETDFGDDCSTEAVADSLDIEARYGASGEWIGGILDKIGRSTWGGPPILADGAPESLAVDVGPKLAAALIALRAKEIEEARTPGTRAYQDAVEAAGQLALLPREGEAG